MNKMSMKLYKVWWAVLEHPGVWMDASDISYCTDLTPRQVVSLMSEVSSPEVDRKITESRPRQCICYTGTPDQVNAMKRQIMTWRYGISSEQIRDVLLAMSTAGWASITDISEETGMSKANVSKILKVMEPGTIDSKLIGTSTLYRRVPIIDE